MITLRGVTKIFRTANDVVRAVDHVDLEVGARQFVVLLGLSGSGKTTLLRCVAGLEKPDAGAILLGDEIVSAPEQGVFVRPEDRGLGMVFQSYAVWPHMTVFENVAFPQLNGRRKLRRAAVRERVLNALEMVQLKGLEHRPAPLLSGGQQQRVALARALAMEPKALLMDEPLSNLDARLRETVREEIKTLTKKLGITVLYVTHDQVEAMAMADTVAVMSAGKILQAGPPQELYDFPSERDVAEFLGSLNELSATTGANGRVDTPLGTLKGLQFANGDVREVMVVIRPSDVSLTRAPTGLDNEFRGRLVSQSFLGDIVDYNIAANGVLISCKTTQRDPVLREGSEVYIRFPADKVKVFAK